MIEGKKFPKIEGESLSGEEVVLPDDAEGEVILVAVAFNRKAQSNLDSWVNHFEEMCDGKEAYELPVIEGSLWRLFSGFIDTGMKSGIPQEKHGRVVTLYGDASEFKEELEIEGKNLGYVFLLDEEGRIIFKGEDQPDEEAKEELLKKIKTVCATEEE